MNRRPRVLIVSGEGTVESLDRMLRRRGVAVTRRTLLRRVPVPSGRLRSELDRFERPEVCLLTSPEGARSLGRLGFLRDRPGGVRLEVLAGGPATAREARRWGARRIRNGTGRGAEVARYLHGHRPRRVVHVRSNRAGPQLARTLRREGHTVLDLTAYRVVPVPDLRRTLERSSRTADLMLATSPSALSALRRGLAPAAFRRLRRRPTLVVLGARSARAARGHGFRGVRIVPSLSPAGIARYLAREVVRGR